MHWHNAVFLDAFTILRKATISFAMPVYLSVYLTALRSAWNHSALAGRIVMKFDIWIYFFFFKSIEKIQVSLKSDKNNGNFIWRPIYIYDHISLISSSNKNVFQAKVLRSRESQNTHFMSNNSFCQKSCRLWDTVEKHGRARQATDDNIIQCMWFACFIPKATNTHTRNV